MLKNLSLVNILFWVTIFTGGVQLELGKKNLRIKKACDGVFFNKLKVLQRVKRDSGGCVFMWVFPNY